MIQKSEGKIWYYNEKYKVKLLKRNGFTVNIQLLEPYPRETRSGTITLPAGDILSVGFWQVREQAGSWKDTKCPEEVTE